LNIIIEDSQKPHRLYRAENSSTVLYSTKYHTFCYDRRNKY